MDGLFGQLGFGAETVPDRQVRTIVFAASFVPIATYVVTFLVVFRRVKGTV